MPAINFTVFTDKVADGSKRQTIRKTDRKGQIRAGVPLQLYTGMRTKACRKLVDVASPRARRLVVDGIFLQYGCV